MAPWLSIVFCLWSFSVYSYVNITRNTLGLQYEFEVENFEVREEIIRKEKFQTIKLEGVENYSGVYHKKGEPELPVIRFYVNGPGDIQVLLTDKKDLSQPLTIRNFMRATDPVPKIAGARKVKPLSIESTLSLDTQYDVTSVGSLRGVSRRLVTLYPVHWNPKTGVVKKTPYFKVVVPHFEVEKDETPLMVLVLPERFSESEALKHFIDHKKSLGISVEKLTFSTEEKDPAFIRAELQKIYNENKQTLKYVLLMGSARLLPGYRTERFKGITDHYYRCLDTEDYESDIGTPDVFLSRLSVKSEEELETQIQKIIDYENRRTRLEEWKKKASFITTNDKEHWQKAEDSSNYTIKKYTEAGGYEGSFPKEATLGGDKLYAVTHKASGVHVLDSINEGRGYIQYSGHGFSGSWDYPRVTMSDVADLADTGALPIVIANACDTAKITATDTIAETWMRNKYGAVFYWGAMDAAYWDEDVVLQKKLSDEIFGENHFETGLFTANALADVWRYYGGTGESKYYWEVYLSLGDPSLKASIK